MVLEIYPDIIVVLADLNLIEQWTIFALVEEYAVIIMARDLRGWGPLLRTF